MTVNQLMSLVIGYDEVVHEQSSQFVDKKVQKLWDLELQISINKSQMMRQIERVVRRLWRSCGAVLRAGGAPTHGRSYEIISLELNLMSSNRAIIKS